MLSLDTEDSGRDFFHGSRPFLVTVCRDDGTQQYWQWEIDPLTRNPLIPDEDRSAVRKIIKTVAGWQKFAPDVQENHVVILQNGKFDITALESAGIIQHGEWPWAMTRDTLLAGHLLASNMPHNLTDMTSQYLGIDIQPFEEKVKAACKEARSIARREFPDWRIAKEGLEDMPSVKGSGSGGRDNEKDVVWKNDMWLLRAMAKELKLSSNHPWWTLVSDYANADSAVTLPLWKAQKQQLEERGLMKIYRERLKLLPIAHRMEHDGVTVLGDRLDELSELYSLQVEERGRLCKNIAWSFKYELELPKGASPNGSLRRFMLDVMNLEPVYSKKSKSGEPTLNKDAMQHWQLTLENNSKQKVFVDTLLGKRARDTQLSFLRDYRRFALPTDHESFWKLHPNINCTGTDTLRWSHSNPNSSNISKKEMECKKCDGEGCVSCGQTGLELYNLRSCFGPSVGREWWSLDAQNIELRIPAYVSGEPALIALFERPNDPPFYGSQHLLNFSVVYEDVWEDAVIKVGIEKAGPWCKKTYRDTWYQWIKNLDFAIQYQCGRATADKAAHRDGSFDRLKKSFDKLEALNQQQIKFANRHGYVETLPDKSVDPDHGYPLLCTRTERGDILTTIPLSYFVQGNAMWWTASAMIKVQDQLDEWRRKDGFDGRIALQIHDELVLDMPASEISPEVDVNKSNLWRIRVIQDHMKKCGENIGIPTPTGAEWHEHDWSTGVTF
jgi:DNA polymerase I-like protein with 3'-5' exonuclease and polymerase domains